MFYARYFASTTSVTGCLKEFIVTPREINDFPASVMYDCNLCKQNHGFRLQEVYVLSTPKQIQRFEEYCTTHNLEYYISFT